MENLCVAKCLPSLLTETTYFLSYFLTHGLDKLKKEDV